MGLISKLSSGLTARAVVSLTSLWALNGQAPQLGAHGLSLRSGAGSNMVPASKDAARRPLRAVKGRVVDFCYNAIRTAHGGLGLRAKNFHQRVDPNKGFDVLRVSREWERAGTTYLAKVSVHKAQSLGNHRAVLDLLMYRPLDSSERHRVLGCHTDWHPRTIVGNQYITETSAFRSPLVDEANTERPARYLKDRLNVVSWNAAYGDRNAQWTTEPKEFFQNNFVRQAHFIALQEANEKEKVITGKREGKQLLSIRGLESWETYGRNAGFKRTQSAHSGDAEQFAGDRVTLYNRRFVRQEADSKAYNVSGRAVTCTLFRMTQGSRRYVLFTNVHLAHLRQPNAQDKALREARAHQETYLQSQVQAKALPAEHRDKVIFIAAGDHNEVANRFQQGSSWHTATSVFKGPTAGQELRWDGLYPQRKTGHENYAIDHIFFALPADALERPSVSGMGPGQGVQKGVMQKFGSDHNAVGASMEFRVFS